MLGHLSAVALVQNKESGSVGFGILVRTASLPQHLVFQAFLSCKNINQQSPLAGSLTSSSMIPTELQSNHYVSSISNISAAPINSTETSNHSLTSKSLPPITIKAVPKSIFEETLSHASLPPPGPLYYAARRALWLAPTNEAPLPSIPSTSRQRLEHLLGMPGAVQNEDVWKAGVEKVWKGLVAGGRLKRRLPMNIVVCSH